MALPSAMSFCNLKDFASTFRTAERYAGPDGHLATMTDIIFGREDNTPVYAAKMDWSYRAPYDSYDELKKWYIRKPAIDRLKGKGFAYAHLLSIGQLIRTGLHVTRYDQLTFNIGTHSWTDGYRLLGMRDGSCTDAKEFRFSKVENKTPKSAYVNPVGETAPEFASLIEVADKLFTEKPKEGCSADTGMAVFEVASAKKIGEPIQINLKSENMFVLRYDLDEVLAVRPDGANAYLRSAFDPRGQWIVVQFYEIEVNRETRLVNEEELASDLDRLMTVVEELETA